MNVQERDTGDAEPPAPDERGGASTRDCVATPSRIVAFLDGNLDPEALQRHEVGTTDGPGSSTVVDSLAELDLPAGLAVFRNPLDPPPRPGDWLRVELLGPRFDHRERRTSRKFAATYPYLAATRL